MFHFAYYSFQMDFKKYLSKLRIILFELPADEPKLAKQSIGANKNYAKKKYLV